MRSRGRGVRYRWRLWRGRRDAPADALHCYEPSSGEVRTVGVSAVRSARLSTLGYPKPFASVVPGIKTRSAAG